MDSKQQHQIKQVIDILVGKSSLIISLLLLALTVGLVYYLITPKTYRATVLLSYEQQRINPSRMSPEQGQRIRDMVGTLSQVVTSRHNLEGIIAQFNLYEGIRRELPIEDIVEMMRDKIKIIPSARGNTFQVSFIDSDQNKVYKVANALASKFIEENLKYREERATETSAYTEDELIMAKEVLDKKEQVMRDFKLKYYNEMPDQRDSNLARLASLNEQYQASQASLQELERTKVMIQEQIAYRKRLATPMTSDSGSSGENGDITTNLSISTYEKLERLRGYLDSLLIKYTERHPEVKRTRNLIAKLEKEVEELGLKESRDKEEQRVVEPVVQDPEIIQLKLQLKEISMSGAELRREQEKIRKEIKQYEEWIEKTPIREAEWAALTRDYNELRKHYDHLVSQNLQAKSVEHLEKKQKGSKFKIIDRARFPEKPFAPDFKKILLMATAAGLGFGCAIAFFFNIIDTSFRDVSDLESYLGVAVSCAIPYVETKKEIKVKKIKRMSFTILLVIYCATLVGVTIYFYQTGRVVF